MSPEEKECFHGLFITDPEEDKTALKRRKGDRVPGTCDWIFQSNELKIWLGEMQETSQQMPNILWLYGNPGTGKSTMAITLAEELPARIYSSTGGGNLAYFFCESGSEHRRTATTILRGLLYQLIKQQPQLVRFLQPKYAERGGRLFSSFDALWAVFIDIAKDGSSGRKYIIIDALDECDQESYEMLLRQLNLTFSKENFRQSMLYIHILITSRPYQEIREELEIYYHKDLASFDKAKEDIQIFINQKVKELQAKKRYTRSVTLDVSRILSEKAEGTFLWIGIACGELYKVPSQNAVKKLESLPRGLHAIYRTLIDAALTRDQFETDQETIMQILSFVAISQRPLNLGELAIACCLYSNKDEAERRAFTRNDVESCRLLVIIQEEKVFLLHKSVKDFLMRHACLPVDELATHARLAYRCVDYLLEYIDANNDKYSDSDELSVNDDRSDKQFVRYSVKYWAKHAHLARSEFTVESRHAKFFDFSSPQREKWLELYRNIRGDRYLYGRYERITSNWSIFHVAAEWGLVPVVEYIFSKKAQIGEIQQFDNMEFEESDGVTPLEVCARHGHSDVMAVLLERGHEKMVPREAVVVAAANSSGNGKEIMRLLLDQRGDQVPITEKVIKRVAQNWTNGADIMGLLLDQRGYQVSITEEVMQTAARNWGNGEEIIRLLLGRRGDQVPVTERVIEAAADNGANGEKIIRVLLDQLGDRLPITEPVMEVAAGNGEEIMRVLLDQLGDRST
jgi:DNA polymerase III delta prime subunit